MLPELSAEDFPAFLAAIYGEDVQPFPWQKRMLATVLDPDRGWPDVVALPTAAGKTSCLDIAVFAMALQGCGAPRRIFFTVDRRVIVDEAYNKALNLARKLQKALASWKVGDLTNPVVTKVAARLQALAGEGALGRHTTPLKAFLLRGGVFRDHRWTEIPTQPLIVATTVDQLGSRLLFRGYGVSQRALPKHAAFVGTDSLIILDEAHCSRPLEQTLSAVHDFSKIGHAQERRGPTVVVMSATPFETKDAKSSFQYDRDDKEHPVLSKRYQTSKWATLSVAKDAVGKGKGSDQLAKYLCTLVTKSLPDGSPKKLAVMVNRVDTARRVVGRLKDALAKKGVDLALMTGRMRELDRKELLADYEPRLKSGSKVALTRSLVVVATQCLEVGADFDFDVLISECASLDALRQRFGRLDRLGALQGKAVAHIVIRGDQVAPKGPDPVYGMALTKTWGWLEQLADRDLAEGLRCDADAAFSLVGSCDGVGSDAADKRVDLSQEKMDRAVWSLSEKEYRELTAPSPEAPILMPAYLDCWVQTSPQPTPEPEVSLFLRGRDRNTAEVRVLWRKDLQDSHDLQDLLSVISPTMCETIPVPLAYFRRWLVEPEPHDDSSDTGEAQDEEPSENKGKGELSSELRGRVFCWRGSERSFWLEKIGQVQPNDVMIIEAGVPGSEGLGDFFSSVGGIIWDRGDEAQFRARRRAVLRIAAPEPSAASISPMQKYLFPDAKGGDDEQREEIGDVDELRECLRDETFPSSWQKAVQAHLLDPETRLEAMPYGDRDSRSGWIIFATERMDDEGSDHITLEFDESLEQLSLHASQAAISLDAHCRSVGQTAAQFAELLGFPKPMVDDLYLAGRLHDLGKSDPRFQAWLANGSRPLADSLELRAKSGGNLGRAARERARCLAGYPKGKRHEFVSAGIVAKGKEVLACAHDPDLVLYLITTHHGMGRPLCDDLADPAGGLKTRPFELEGICLSGSVDQQMGLPNQGHNERFWSLIQKYGWWGLSCLEAYLVCADHLCSKDPAMGAAPRRLELREPGHPGAPTAVCTLSLGGIDGSHLVGFLCALGVLRTLTRAGIEAKLSWRKGVCWVPILYLSLGMAPEELSACLHKQLKGAAWPTPIDKEDNTTKFDRKDYRAWVDSARKRWIESPTMETRTPLDWLGALAGEVMMKDKDGLLCDTAFRTMSGAGHQHFLKTMRELGEKTEPEHIHAALFECWNYSDEGPTLRFDPIDDRRYAYRADNPSTPNSKIGRIRAVRGANRLAAEALSLYPTWPRQGGLETAGFQTGGANETFFFWPLWQEPMSLRALPSVLWNRGWETWSPERLSALGVSELFCVQRFTNGKVRNFTPSRAVIGIQDDADVRRRLLRVSPSDGKVGTGSKDDAEASIAE